MNTYYITNADKHARYWYDRSLRVWTVCEVTRPNDKGDQIGDADYSATRDQAEQVAKQFTEIKL